MQKADTVVVRPLLAMLIAALVALPFVAPPPLRADSRPVHAPHAVVASIDELASKAGVEIMRQGGNAVDAAVATGFALAVVYPQAGNLGGGGFMLLRTADGKTHFIDFREEAPAAATAKMYLDADGNVIPGASEYGYKAIGVPGSVAGLVYAEKKYGKLPLPQVMAPAIRLARSGYVLTWQQAQDLREDSHLADYPESRKIFQRDGNFYKQYEVFPTAGSGPHTGAHRQRPRRFLSRGDGQRTCRGDTEGRGTAHR